MKAISRYSLPIAVFFGLFLENAYHNNKLNWTLSNFMMVVHETVLGLVSAIAVTIMTTALFVCFRALLK